MALHESIAWRPATPAPIMNTYAAEVFPAAVICIFENLSS